MRHFLRAARAPACLARSVFTRSAAVLLIALPRPAPRFAPALSRAAFRAVAVAAVTFAADAHLLRAARAAIQPITVLACLHVLHTALDNAVNYGHKGKRNAPSHARSVEGPGFLSGIRPGLRLSGVRTQRIAHTASPRSSLTSRARAQSQSTFDLIRRRRLPRAPSSSKSTLYSRTRAMNHFEGAAR